MSKKNNAKKFLFRIADGLAERILNGHGEIKIKKSAYDASCEDEIIKILLSLDGVRQAMPGEEGITIITERR